MKRKNLIWKTVRGNRIAFDSKTGALIVAPRWFKKYYERKKKG